MRKPREIPDREKFKQLIVAGEASRELAWILLKSYSRKEVYKLFKEVYIDTFSSNEYKLSFSKRYSLSLFIRERFPNRFKIRFNLGKGKNFMKWKIVELDGTINYHDPYDPSIGAIIITDGKLINKRKTAEKIYNGADKTVCAWIETSYYTHYHSPIIVRENSLQIHYNPKIDPYWKFNGENVDGNVYNLILFQGKVYIDDKK